MANPWADCECTKTAALSRWPWHAPVAQRLRLEAHVPMHNEHWGPVLLNDLYEALHALGDGPLRVDELVRIAAQGPNAVREAIKRLRLQDASDA